MGAFLNVRARVAVAVSAALSFIACHELPSGVPLANAGGVLDDTGTERDRRPQAMFDSAAVQKEAKPSMASPVHGPPPVVAERPLDAGAPDAAVAAGDAGTTAVVWAGDYLGSDRLVRHFDGESDDVELDDKAHTRVEQSGSGTLVISIINSASSDVICTLRATAQGTTAALEPGQSCFGDEGSTATVTDGHLTLTADRLVLDLDGKVVENDEDDDGDTLEFRLEYHFDGRRR
jgi:hypothetical protein